MSTQQRPAGPAPAGQEKVKLDVVFATSPDGKVYELPSEVATKYEVTEERAKQLGHVPIIPRDYGEDEEVGGRHRTLGSDGTLRHHSNWQTGPYVWHRDYRSYNGPHWHPNPESPLAYDMNDY
jgi:hypothetical protein